MPHALRKQAVLQERASLAARVRVQECGHLGAMCQLERTRPDLVRRSKRTCPCDQKIRRDGVRSALKSQIVKSTQCRAEDTTSAPCGGKDGAREPAAQAPFADLGVRLRRRAQARALAQQCLHVLLAPRHLRQDLALLYGRACLYGCQKTAAIADCIRTSNSVFYSPTIPCADLLHLGQNLALFELAVFLVVRLRGSLSDLLVQPAAGLWFVAILIDYVYKSNSTETSVHLAESTDDPAFNTEMWFQKCGAIAKRRKPQIC